MSYVQFKRIYGKNYNSLGSFDLPITPGRHLVIGDNTMTGGSNGAGKSSVFESVIWTLFKKYARGSDPSFNGLGNCETGVEVDLGNGTYNIERFYKHSTLGNAARLTLDGDDISNRLTDGVDTEVAKVVPIPHDLFVSTCVVMQGLPINFTQFTPTTRKAIIEDALGFSVWDGMRKRFGKKLKELGEIRSKAEEMHSNMDRELTDLSARIEAMTLSLEGKSEELVAKQARIKEELVALRDSLTSINSEYKEALSGLGSIGDLRQHLENTQRELSEVSIRLRDINTIIKEEVCPTCGTPYPQSKMVEAKKGLKELAPKEEKMKKEVFNIKARIQGIEALDRKVREYNTSLGNKKKELASINAEIAQQGETQADKEMVKMRERLQSLVDSVNASQEEIQNYVRDMGHLEFIDSTLLPSSVFRTQVLAKYLVRITEILKGVTPSVFNDVQVELAVDKKATGVNINILRKNKAIEYKQLSGGERRRLDIIIILAFQRFLMEASGVRTNMVVFDEPFEGLDSGGVDAVLNCMDSLFPEDMAIYVISHNADLKSRFNSVVRVVKENGVSRLVV